MSLNSHDAFVKAPDLEVNQVPDGYIVYQTTRDHVHYLNPVASVVFELCDAENSVADIGDLLRDAYQLPAVPEEELTASLERLVAEGLILPCTK